MKSQVDTIYKLAERLAEITKKSIIGGNIPRAKKILVFAEHLLISGSKDTRNIISGVYIHSVSTFMEARNCSIANLFPKSLQAEYIKQINSSGV